MADLDSMTLIPTVTVPGKFISAAAGETDSCLPMRTATVRLTRSRPVTAIRVTAGQNLPSYATKHCLQLEGMRQIGDEVQGLWPNGRWYDATIVEVHKDKFVVDWKDKSTENRVLLFEQVQSTVVDWVRCDECHQWRAATVECNDDDFFCAQLYKGGCAKEPDNFYAFDKKKLSHEWKSKCTAEKLQSLRESFEHLLDRLPREGSFRNTTKTKLLLNINSASEVDIRTRLLEVQCNLFPQLRAEDWEPSWKSFFNEGAGSDAMDVLHLGWLLEELIDWSAVTQQRIAAYNAREKSPQTHEKKKRPARFCESSNKRMRCPLSPPASVSQAADRQTAATSSSTGEANSMMMEGMKCQIADEVGDIDEENLGVKDFVDDESDDTGEGAGREEQWAEEEEKQEDEQKEKDPISMPPSLAARENTAEFGLATASTAAAQASASAVKNKSTYGQPDALAACTDVDGRRVLESEAYTSLDETGGPGMKGFDKRGNVGRSGKHAKNSEDRDIADCNGDSALKLSARGADAQLAQMKAMEMIDGGGGGRDREKNGAAVAAGGTIGISEATVRELVAEYADLVTAFVDDAARLRAAVCDGGSSALTAAEAATSEAARQIRRATALRAAVALAERLESVKRTAERMEDQADQLSCSVGFKRAGPSMLEKEIAALDGTIRSQLDAAAAASGPGSAALDQMRDRQSIADALVQAEEGATAAESAAEAAAATLTSWWIYEKKLMIAVSEAGAAFEVDASVTHGGGTSRAGGSDKHSCLNGLRLCASKLFALMRQAGATDGQGRCCSGQFGCSSEEDSCSASDSCRYTNSSSSERALAGRGSGGVGCAKDSATNGMICPISQRVELDTKIDKLQGLAADLTQKRNKVVEALKLHYTTVLDTATKAEAAATACDVMAKLIMDLAKKRTDLLQYCQAMTMARSRQELENRHDLIKPLEEIREILKKDEEEAESEIKRVATSSTVEMLVTAAINKDLDKALQDVKGQAELKAQELAAGRKAREWAELAADALGLHQQGLLIETVPAGPSRVSQ